MDQKIKSRQNAFKSTRGPSEFVLIMSSKKTAGELNPTTATKEMFTQTLTSISTGVFRCDDQSPLIHSVLIALAFPWNALGLQAEVPGQAMSCRQWAKGSELQANESDHFRGNTYDRRGHNRTHSKSRMLVLGLVKKSFLHAHCFC